MSLICVANLLFPFLNTCRNFHLYLHKPIFRTSRWISQWDCCLPSCPGHKPNFRLAHADCTGPNDRLFLLFRENFPPEENFLHGVIYLYSYMWVVLRVFRNLINILVSILTFAFQTSIICTGWQYAFGACQDVEVEQAEFGNIVYWGLEHCNLGTAVNHYD